VLLKTIGKRAHHLMFGLKQYLMKKRKNTLSQKANGILKIIKNFYREGEN